MTSTVYKAFFGDTEHAFCLTPALIIQLERHAGMGIGAIAQGVFAGRFRHSDLCELIRLALIGAGTAPQRATELVDTYAKPQPLKPVQLLATDILNTLMNGSPDA